MTKTTTTNIQQDAHVQAYLWLRWRAEQVREYREALGF